MFWAIFRDRDTDWHNSSLVYLVNYTLLYLNKNHQHDLEIMTRGTNSIDLQKGLLPQCHLLIPHQDEEVVGTVFWFWTPCVANTSLITLQKKPSLHKKDLSKNLHVHTFDWKMTYFATLPETNNSPLKIGLLPQPSSSNQWFLRALTFQELLAFCG